MSFMSFWQSRRGLISSLIVTVGVLGGAGFAFRGDLQNLACSSAAGFGLRDATHFIPNCIYVMPLGSGAEEEEEGEGAVRPDHPGDAVKFRLKRMRDEKGNIPFDGVIRAAAQMDAMNRDALTRVKSESASVRGVLHGKWASLGPGNVGGRTRSIAIHPTNPNIMWLGSVGGGIWKTTNGGVSWNVVNDFLANMAVSTIVVNKANPLVLYAGTGEGFYNGDGLRGAGIMRSVDGGTTWAQLASTNNPNFLYVNRIAISTDGTVLLAATRSGVFRSVNSGASWVQTSTQQMTYVAINPADKTKAIASGFYGKSFYSVNGGTTWTQSNVNLNNGSPLFTRLELAYAPSNPAIVFLSADMNKGELWKSTNGGASFVKVNTGLQYLQGQGWYDNALWVSPTNPNVVIVGGLDLWRSVNGGASFTKISNWMNAPVSAHADHHFIIASPAYNGTTNKTVFFGNDGGIYKAADVLTVSTTSGWQELNNTLGITQFYSAAGNATTGQIIGGTQDNGTIFYKPTTGPQAWTRTEGGDGGYSAADPTNPNIFYGEYVYLNLHRSTDGGRSVTYIYNGITDADFGCAQFIAPFKLDPNNANRMLAGGCSLWRSNNVKAATPSWSEIRPYGFNNSAISAIAVAPGNSNFVMIGYDNGDVYRSTNATAASPTWTKVNGLPARYVTSIAIASNKTTVYVSFGGFSTNNIYKSLNSGVNFAPASGPLGTSQAIPTAPVYSVIVDPSPARVNWIYAGTEVGVVASEDGGAHWISTFNGPSKTSVDELVFVGTKLVAATHGRGLFLTTPVDLP